MMTKDLKAGLNEGGQGLLIRFVGLPLLETLTRMFMSLMSMQYLPCFQLPCSFAPEDPKRRLPSFTSYGVSTVKQIRILIPSSKKNQSNIHPLRSPTCCGFSRSRCGSRRESCKTSSRKPDTCRPQAAQAAGGDSRTQSRSIGIFWI